MRSPLKVILDSFEELFQVETDSEPSIQITYFIPESQRKGAISDSKLTTTYEYDFSNTPDAQDWTNVNDYVRNIAKVMEDAFEKLKRDGKNNIDNVVQWLKDSKIIDTAKDSEEKARKMLAQVKDTADRIDLDKFKDTVNKMVDEKSSQLADLAKAAKAGATGLRNAFGAATSAFKDAMNK